MAATSAATADIAVESTATLQWYEASEGVFYGFCSTCGSSLFWRNDDESERWSIGAGTLDPPTGLDTSVSIWTAEASDYHDPTPGPARPFD